MIKIVTADIYLRFPEIMEEEFEDLTEFIEESHIKYEGATDIVYNLKKENADLKQALNDIRECIYKNRKEYSNHVNSVKDWIYIKDKDILIILDQIKQVYKHLFEVNDIKEG
ncbi:MAG: hypothetical protein V8R01_01815 [Bacilli bacterium]